MKSPVRTDGAAGPPQVNWFDPWVWALPFIALVLAALLWLTDSNQALFYTLNHLGGSQSLWAGMTLFGDSLIAFTLLLPLIGKRPDMIWVAFLAAVVAMLWVHGLKPVLDIPRPTAVLPLEAIRVIGPEIHARAFPSGHTATAFTLAGVVALGIRSFPLRLLLIVLATLVGVSRVAVSAHWPMDVLGGAFGGWLAATLGWVWSRHWTWGTCPLGQRVLALILTFAALYLLLGYDARYHDADGLKLAIGLLALVLGFPGLIRLLRVTGPFSRKG